jgi:hypothetical protein
MNFVNFRGLDSPKSESYLRLIPIHRLPGGAIRARVGFSFRNSGLSSDEMGRLAPRGAEEG